MAQYPQFYGGDGVPFVIDADPGDPFRAWSSQRARLRAWVAGLDEDGWAAPTRCPAWNARGLVQHLSSGAAFLGYTLHEAGKGNATEFLVGLDTHTTIEAATATLDALSLEELQASLEQADASIAKQAARHGDAGWTAIAEAPPGHMRGHLVLSHFVWDSWVHEYDLLLPVGQRPPLEQHETAVAARYLLALATANLGLDRSIEVRLTDVDLRIAAHGDGARVTILPDGHVPGAPVVEGTALDVFDRATGRESGPVEGDRAGLDLLDAMAAVLN